MAQNEVNFRGTQLTVLAPIAANSGVGPNSGDPLIFGTGTSPSFGIACVAETSYTPPSGLTPTGYIAIKTEGVFSLLVTPQQSPGGTSQTIKPGDRIYAANDGSFDATTGCYYGFSLCPGGGIAAASGIHFGNSLDTLTGGATKGYIRVRLKNGG